MTRKAYIFGVVLGLLAAGTGFGDGYKVRRWLSHADIVRASRYIFIGIVVENKPIYAKRRAYGEMRRYVVRHRLLVQIVRMLKGDAALYRAMGKEPGPVWIERYGGSVPGKWVLIDEKYRETISPEQLKAGMRVLVYASNINDLIVTFEGLDTVGMVPKTEALLLKK